MMRVLAGVVVCWGLVSASLWSQPSWRLPYRSMPIQIDGFLSDWSGVPKMTLSPGSPGIQVKGEFGPDDLEVTVQGLWDEQSLYMAIQWKDDVWDIQEVRRRDAVYVTTDRKRRDRMYFFDNFKVHLREIDYDYLLWLSPRVNDVGPFHWERLLRGMRSMEAATTSPVITPRFEEGQATLELLFSWEELRIRQKQRRAGIGLSLAVADSDQPQAFLESKVSGLKWVEWHGRLIFEKKR